MEKLKEQRSKLGDMASTTTTDTIHFKCLYDIDRETRGEILLTGLEKHHVHFKLIMFSFFSSILNYEDTFKHLGVKVSEISL
jgi:hypothetical protein